MPRWHRTRSRKCARYTHFDSTEAYTPIFDGNARELRSLSVKVLTNITAFYTYWKATRDALRRLANTKATTASFPVVAEDNAWHRAMRDVIYMQFLACESARRALRDLVEFEPNNAEATITVLLSELRAYGFLLRHFGEGDVRRSRLELRRDRYREHVPQLYYQAEDQHARHQGEITVKRVRRVRRENLEEVRRDWEKAHRMLEDLRRRFESSFGDFPDRGKR